MNRNLPPDDPRHGLNGYTNLGCRCAECRAANAESNRLGRERRAAQLAADPKSHPHGIYSTYTNYGCRCAECRAANANHARRRNAILAGDNK